MIQRRQGQLAVTATVVQGIPGVEQENPQHHQLREQEDDVHPCREGDAAQVDEGRADQERQNKADFRDVRVQVVEGHRRVNVKQRRDQQVSSSISQPAMKPTC